MALHRLFSRAACFLAVLALAFGMKPAVADTFTVLDLGIAQSNVVVGIDTAGDVVISGLDFCGTIGNPGCYKTYVNGVLSSISATLPPLAYDNGTPCTPLLPLIFNPGLAVCNNGRYAFGNRPQSVPPAGAYAGPNPIVFVHSGTVDGPIVMNASGDFAWTDGRDEENWEAIDTSVPEPSALLLLATGALGFAGAIRRRLCGHPA